VAVINLAVSLPRLLSIADLQTRWDWTRQGIHRRMELDADFPKPIMTVSNGKIRLFLESDIEEYEKLKPWTTDKYWRSRRPTWIFTNHPENI